MDELAKSQEQLGKALERAKMGEDLDLAGRVRDMGERLVRILYGLIKMTEIHDIDNAAFLKPSEEFETVCQDLMDLLGAVHIVTVEDQVFVNDIRIRLGRAQNASSLGTELASHQVGGLTFHQAPSPDQFKLLIQILSGDPLSEDTPRASLIDRLGQEGMDFIDLFGIYRFRVSGDNSAKVLSHERVSNRAASLIEESWDNLAAERLPNPLPLRRAVTDILEVSKDDPDIYLEQPVLDNEFGHHTLKVCRLSLLIAKEAKLSEEAIQDLGVCAMFHDMGYATREGADPAQGEAGYAPPYERHASAGARMLLRQRGFHQAKIRRALSTLEHHRDYSSKKGRPSIFARIIRIAEDFANLTRASGGGLNPHEALVRMSAYGGKYYDYILLQAFVNRLGKYPPGTLLEVEMELKGNPMTFILLSQSLVRSPETFDKPICRLVRLHDGREPPPAMAQRPIDLANKGEVLRVLNDY